MEDNQKNDILIEVEKVMASLEDLPQTPSFTCPYINSVISGITDAIKMLSKADEDSFKENISDALFYLNNTFDELEFIRKCNEELRDVADGLRSRIEDVNIAVDNIKNIVENGCH